MNPLKIRVLETIYPEIVVYPPSHPVAPRTAGPGHHQPRHHSRQLRRFGPLRRRRQCPRRGDVRQRGPHQPSVLSFRRLPRRLRHPRQLPTPPSPSPPPTPAFLSSASPSPPCRSSSRPAPVLPPQTRQRSPGLHRGRRPHQFLMRDNPAQPAAPAARVNPQNPARSPPRRRPRPRLRLPRPTNSPRAASIRPETTIPAATSSARRAPPPRADSLTATDPDPCLFPRRLALGAS